MTYLRISNFTQMDLGSADTEWRYRNSKDIVQSAMRVCAECRQRRSIAQFTGDSTMCLKCVRRGK